jgi:hypothetical protein
MKCLLPGSEGVVDGYNVCLCLGRVSVYVGGGVGVVLWEGWGVSRFSPS